MSESNPIVGSSDKPHTSDRVSGAFLAVLMLAAFVIVSGRVVEVAMGPLPPGAGKAAPAFVGPDLSGVDQSLARHRGQVVLLDFWATWCPPCVASMPELERAYQKMKDEGFVVLGINQEPDQPEDVRLFVRSRGLSFPIVLDPGTIKRDYGVFSFPTSFLLSRDGTICEVFHGPISLERLEAATRPLLAASPDHTGC